MGREQSEIVQTIPHFCVRMVTSFGLPMSLPFKSNSGSKYSSRVIAVGLLLAAYSVVLVELCKGNRADDQSDLFQPKPFYQSMIHMHRSLGCTDVLGHQRHSPEHHTHAPLYPERIPADFCQLQDNRRGEKGRHSPLIN